MIDIHNHLLYGIDDGSQSIEDSIEALRCMREFGYTDIILTPHYIKDSRYSSSASHNFELLKTLKKELKNNNIDIRLYLGNEIFMDDDIFDLLKEGEIYSLNGTSYLLIELPMNGEYPDYIEVFKDLIDKGCHVILAHPERYYAFQMDYKKVDEVLRAGVLLQSNIDSLNGKYGSEAERMIKRLLKEKKISFIATDSHHKKHNYGEWTNAKNVALKFISEEEFNKLTVENPGKLIH